MTQRIDFLWIRRKELNPFSLNTMQRIEPFFLNMTQRIEPSFQKVLMNWTLLIDALKNLYLFLNTTHRILTYHFFFFAELIFFLNTVQRIKPFFSDITQKIDCFQKMSQITELFSMTQRIEPCVKKKDSGNGTFVKKRMTQRIELFLMTHRIEPLFRNLFSIWHTEMKSFFNMTQRIELFSQYDSKNWTSFHMSYFFTRLKELIFN